MLLDSVSLGKYLHIHCFQFAVTLNMSLISGCEQNIAMGGEKHMARCLSIMLQAAGRHDPGAMTHTDENQDADLSLQNELEERDFW